MESFEFSQQDILVLLNLLNQVSVKIPDAKLMIPIEEKLRAKLKPESKPEVELTKPN